MNAETTAHAAETSNITPQQEYMVPIAAFTATGEIDQLKPALVAGLEHGLTINEIKEVLVHLYAYTGFPRSLNGLQAFMDVLNTRQEAGIKDPQGKAATPVPENMDSVDAGNTVRNTLVGVDLTDNQAPYAQFAPIIDTYLKSHLFGDIFARDALTHKQREWATISALAAMTGTQSQLGAHIHMAQNAGITQTELTGFITALKTHVSVKAAQRAAEVIQPEAAQNTQNLPEAEDVSRGADNFYASDILNREKVTFLNQYKMPVTGYVYRPKNRQDTEKMPALIVGHPMGAVKEQASNLYAQKMAEKGFITLAMDLSFWGESAGQPRNAVLPDIYAEDFSAAADYLSTLTEVDADKIGVIGVCGSGGFALSEAKIDQRLKAIATVSMYDMGTATRHGLQNSLTQEQRANMVAAASTQRTKEFAGADVAYTGGTAEEISADAHPIAKEFYDFYRTQRGAFVPQGTTLAHTTHPTLSSNVKFLNFYPFNDLASIAPRPVLFIAGEQAHSLEFSEQAYAQAAEPKELYLVPNAGHVDLYDRTDVIPFEKLDSFFKNALK